MNIYKSETQAQKDKLNSKGIAVINHTKQLRKEKRAMAKASRRKAKEILSDNN